MTNESADYFPCWIEPLGGLVGNPAFVINLDQLATSDLVVAFGRIHDLDVWVMNIVDFAFYFAIHGNSSGSGSCSARLKINKRHGYKLVKERTKAM